MSTTKAPRTVTVLSKLRRICRAGALGVAASVLIGTAGVAQSAMQERILERRLTAPAIAERIEVRRFDDGQSAFAGLEPSGTNRIVGVVINEQGVMLPSSGTIIVRSLATGRAVANTDVDAFGRFSLRGVFAGVYTAELVNASGGVLTSTPAFSISAGEVVQLTPVLSQTSIGGLAQFLSSGTSAALNAAIAAGILSVAPLPADSAK